VPGRGGAEHRTTVPDRLFTPDRRIGLEYFMAHPNDDTAPDARVTCPTCRGSELMVSKSSNRETTYLRCLTCGEVWNALRHSATHQRPTRHGYDG
jgi:DNA-directed RNA polymerase subunit M/transcription elongation factor TFIIS